MCSKFFGVRAPVPPPVGEPRSSVLRSDEPVVPRRRASCWRRLTGDGTGRTMVHSTARDGLTQYGQDGSGRLRTAKILDFQGSPA